MKYMNANSIQRFIAYLVDFSLISLVVNIIVKFIPAYTNNINMVSEYYSALMQGDVVNIDVAELTEILACALKAEGILTLIELPLFVLYLVVLPYFWKYQTIGRCLMHIKVISKTEEKANFGNLLLRELIGGYILLNILSFSIIVPILYWYLSSTAKRTPSDYIGGTRLIDVRFINADYLPKEDTPFQEHSDYVDATFKDVTDESNEDVPTDSSKEDEESEYKVF